MIFYHCFTFFPSIGRFSKCLKSDLIFISLRRNEIFEFLLLMMEWVFIFKFYLRMMIFRNVEGGMTTPWVSLWERSKKWNEFSTSYSRSENGLIFLRLHYNSETRRYFNSVPPTQLDSEFETHWIRVNSDFNGLVIEAANGRLQRH